MPRVVFENINDICLPPFELLLLMFSDVNRDICPPLPHKSRTGAMRAFTGAGMWEELSMVPGVFSFYDKN